MFEPTSTLETPSTIQLTALRRPPLIEMLTVLVRPTPTSSDRSLDTPGDQRRELDEVAVVERQLLHLRRPHQRLQLRRRLDELLRGVDLDVLVDAADAQLAVDLEPVVDVQLRCP